MKSWFPICYAIVSVAEPAPVVISEIQSAALQSKKLSVVTISDKELILRVKHGSLLYHNSFEPITTISLEQHLLQFKFDLQRGTKIMMSIIFVLAMLFMVGISVSCAYAGIPVYFALLPLGVIAFEVGFAGVGLWIMSRQMLHTLCERIAAKESSSLPCD